MSDITIAVPATSANLGSGFDSLGVALGLHDEVTVRLSDEPGVRVRVEGVGAGSVPQDERNLVAASALTAFDALGVRRPVGLEMTTRNRIPHGRGLGSSGAAVVAGILAAVAVVGDRNTPSDEELLRIATDIEGHPDNVAPALFGGVTIAWTTSDGPKYSRIAPDERIVPVALIPSFTLSTATARSLQPNSVPLSDAVFNLARSALMVAAITNAPELLFDATDDRLHQRYRLPAMRESGRIVEHLRDRGHATAVSGAGPSVIVLATSRDQVDDIAAVVAASGTEPWRVEPLAIDQRGARRIRSGPTA